MFVPLLYLGLCVTAFAIFPGADIREIKMSTAIVFALALGMAEIFSKGIKPNKNIWVLIFLAYIPISIMLAPYPQLNLLGMNISDFWVWKPFCKILIFVILFLVVSSHEFKPSQLRMTLNVIVWCGVITALYEVAQFIWTDQFFKVVADGDWGRIAGFIGNPTLTSPFVAMTVPIAMYLKKWVKCGILITGAILPDSQMAWIALFCGIVFYIGMKNRERLAWTLVAFLLSIISFFLLYKYCHWINNEFADHERFIQWHQIFKDWIGPVSKEYGFMNTYGLTGRGIGSFQYVYHIQNIHVGSPNRFHQAHNDFLELGYSLGFAGLGFFLMAILHMFVKTVSFKSRYQRALLASLVVMAVSASGVFIWQIGTTAFYSVVIAGLLHNEKKLNGPI